MAGKLAFIFPGQGAQYIGMGREIAQNYGIAGRVFAEADDVLGFRLTEKVFYGTAEELKQTEITQPAILATSIACLQVLRNEYGLHPDGAAGLSLGEYSALVCAGALSFDEALLLVQKRGRYMQEALPPGVSGMAALLGLERGKVLEACRLSAEYGVVEPANFNAPDQIVIAGELAALRNACRIAKELGAKRVIELPVSVSFHCSLLKNVENLLAQALDNVTMLSANLPVVANVSAEYVRTPEEIRLALIHQVSHAVLWQDSVEKFAADGYEIFVEVGPGKSLTGLVKKINPGLCVHHVEDLQTVRQVVKYLQQKEEAIDAVGW
jgi:[acyl-carrier-protein] S-malonyltransferase